MSYYERVLIYPYNVASQSAKNLKQELIERGIPCKLIRKERSMYRPREGDLVINWGNSTDTEWNKRGRTSVSHYRILNQPMYVGSAINKRKAFNTLIRASDVTIPLYWSDINSALYYANEHEEPFDIVARTKLTGHGGEGAYFFKWEDWTRPDSPVHALDIKLITRYWPKKYEYRIHVGSDQILLVQQKKRNTNIPNEQVNWKIRNNDNGFIYAVDDIVQPNSDILRMARKAVYKLGLDYGAVDIIFNEHHQQAMVLEVNTACGLTGESSRKAYGEYFFRWFDVGYSETPLAVNEAPTNEAALSETDRARIQELSARFQARTPTRISESTPSLDLSEMDATQIRQAARENLERVTAERRRMNTQVFATAYNRTPE